MPLVHKSAIQISTSHHCFLSCKIVVQDSQTVSHPMSIAVDLPNSHTAVIEDKTTANVEFA
jgi:hypothetical protein